MDSTSGLGATMAYYVQLNNTESGNRHISLPTLWVLFAFKIVINLLIIIGNLIVCVVIALSRELWNQQCCFILSMTVSDLAAGLILPLTLSPGLLGVWPYSQLLCDVTAYMMAFLGGTSLFSMAALSFDRFLAIHFPYRYDQWLTRKRCVLLVLLIWVTFALGVMAIPLYGHFPAVYAHESHQCLPGFHLIPGMLFVTAAYLAVGYVLIIVFNCLNLRVAHKHVRAIHHAREHKPPANINVKATVTVAMLMAVLIVCWTPLIVTITIRFLNKGDLNNIYDVITFWIFYFNSFANCVVYSMRTKNFRMACTEILRKGLYRSSKKL